MMSDRAPGSFDDRPEEIDLPGVDAKLTPEQKKAVKALKTYYRIKADNKEAKKEMKEVEERAAKAAFEALDAIKVTAGKLGPAIFMTEWKRKLKVELDEHVRAQEGPAS